MLFCLGVAPLRKRIPQECILRLHAFAALRSAGAEPAARFSIASCLTVCVDPIEPLRDTLVLR
jgi:hypothetical protein